MIDQLAKDPLFHLGLGLLGSPNFASGVQNGLLSYGGFQQGELARQQLRQKMEDQRIARERDQAMRDAMGTPMEQMGDYAGPPRQASGLFSTDIKEREMAKLRMAQNAADPVAAMSTLFPQTKATRDPLKMVMTPEGPRYVPESMAAGMTPHDSPSTVIDMGGGSDKYWETVGKALPTRISGYTDRAKAARDLQNSLLRFRGAMERIGDTGPWEARAKQLREFAGSWGYPINESELSSATAVDQAAKMMVAEQLRMNKGPQTDFDAQFASEYLPSLGKPSEANNEALEYMSSVARLQSLLGSMATAAYNTGDFKSAFGVINNIDDIAGRIPATIKRVITNEDGEAESHWVMFDEYYRDAKQEGMGDMEIIDEWLAAAETARRY